MRKISSLLFITLLLSACSSNQQATTSETSQKNILTKIKEDNAYAYYQGEIEVSGKFRECAIGLLCQTLCFYPNDERSPLIPREKNDDRIAWFCFNDQEKAKTLFGVPDSEIFKDPRFEDPNSDCQIEGEATIKISNYAVLKMETAGYDTADLQKIISKTDYQRECE